MPGVGKLLKQAQKMQKAMEAVQAELEQMSIEGSAAGGAVRAVVNGQGTLKSIKLDPEFLKEDAESVESSILAAVNDAAAKAKAKSEEEMGKVTGGFGIPGII
ncbi:MAG: nucleoid-associated protein, YbaB/EbfC family [Verrucomicrobia bacterium]|nr:MAG: nucleoid-associated protein, YbaB/EbfC family [Verrucomicrobiota bacterium]